MSIHRRALRRLRMSVALFCIVLMAAACNLGPATEQALETPSGTTTFSIPATRTLIPGVPTSRVVTTTPIPFPTRVAQVFPTAYVPPQTNPQPTATSLPYSIVILSPLPGNVIAGNVQVLGSAIHPQFLQYRLEFGPDPNPNNLWFPITGVVQTPILNGALGVWSTVAGGSPDGNYQIRLRVFLRDGSQQITVVNNIRVQNQAPTPVPTATQSTQPPVAAFTQDYTTGNAPLVVRFFNQSQGNITSYLWNFGTGNLSSALNPIETFTRPGIYNVTLTVSGPGGTANVTRQINVVSPGAPTASFIPNTLSGPAPLTVSFTNRSTGNITGYDWDFGDGTTSKEVNPKHVFKAVGNYNVILRATGPGGANTAVRQITVSNPQIPAPVADFVPGATSANVDSSITFSNKSTGNITGYLWDLDGDGLTNSTDKDPTFRYTTAGKFNVNLKAVGPGGVSSKTIQIEIKNPPTAPVANFTANPISGTAPLPVKFTNSTTGNVTEYEWDFNADGLIDSTDKDPSFTYVNAGTYIARLKVTGPGGSTQKDLNISVSAPVPPAPVAAFTADPTSGQSPLTVTFTNTSTGQVDSFSWDFNGDGKADNSVDGTVQFTYNAPGTYAAALTVSNTGGSDTEQVTITVNAPPGAPVASFSAAPESGEAPLSVTFTNTSTGTVDKVEWDFNNDTVIDSTAAGPVQFTYSTPGTYTVKMTVSNSGGAASATKTIEVETPLPDAPVAAFTADPTSGDAPLTVTFTSTSTGAIDQIEWDFNGDGTVDNSADNTASFAFEDPGTYQATLKVSNAGGEDTETITITVNEPSVAAPVADFTASPTSGDAPLTVTFTDVSTGTVDSRSWDFNGDGTPDNTTDETATFTFEAPGTYESALIVTNEGGSNTKIVTITVSEPVQQVPDAPVAAFTAAPNPAAVNETVAFTSTSTGTVDSYAWDFGDGTTSTEQNPSHAYGTAGSYTVTLTVTNAGGSNTATQTITASAAVPGAPVAAFTADPTSGSAPLTVTFNNTSTGTVDSLAWDFNGDGTVDNTSAPNATFTFDAPGTYTASLTVTNAGGSNTATQTITVDEAVPGAPVAVFSADPTSGNAPLTVTFTNNSTGTVESVAWDFNADGTTDSTSNGVVTFTYETAGTYTARLTVTNAGGSDSEDATITVAEALPDAPVASFTANPTSLTAGQSVTFTNTSTGTVDSLAWDFNGDGTTDSSEANPTFTYPDTGTFTASLTVTNASGSNSATQVITVGAPVPSAPVAGLTASATTVDVGTPITFTNTSTGTVDSISWDFNGDGTADSSEANPTFTYDTPGNYTASVTVTNAGGSNTATQQITVNAPAPVAPVASFTTSDIDITAGESITFTNASTGTVDTFAWDFNGDGTPDNTTDLNPVFTYTEPGPYTASLTVTNAGGTNTFSQGITVNPAAAPPTASFTADPTTVEVGGTVTFTSTSTGTTDSFAWDFGDSVTSTEQNPSHTYGAEGTYTVTLTVTGAGQTSTTSTQIVVNAAAPTVPQGQVVYVSNGEIFLANTDGTEAQQLTTDSSADESISVNGDSIVFVSDRDPSGGKDLYLLNVNTLEVTPLTEDEFDDSDPVLSPNGDRIAFISTRDGNSDLWVMNADGTGQTQLTTASSVESQPTWSPDADYIAFVSNRDDGSGTDNDIYWIKLDDNTVKNLTSDDLTDEREPAWAPDGSRIAYTSDRNGSDDIWVMNPSDGGDKQPRAEDPAASETQPSWDTTGDYILYLKDGNPYIMKDNGTEQMPLGTGSTSSIGWR